MESRTHRNDFEIINEDDIPEQARIHGTGALDPLTRAVSILPHGKAIRKSFLTKKLADMKRRSLLSTFTSSVICTRIYVEGDTPYLYIWRRKSINAS